MKYNFSSITLNITQGCNLRCKYCQVKKEPESMDKKTLIKALNWVENNVENPFVSFFGGEPLLEYDLIKWAIENYPNIHFGLSTNLTLLTPEKIKFFFDNDIKLLLSIDGIGEIHNLSRDNSWNKFSNLLPILGELFSDAVFRITITPENVKNLYETVYIGSQLGFINFNALPDGMDQNWTIEDFEELKRQLTYLWDDKKLKKYFKPFQDYEWRLKYNSDEIQCCDGKTTISILPNGNFSLCGEQTKNELFIVGDLEHGINQEKINNFWKNFKECPIKCKANPICSKERCFSRRINNYNDLNARIKVHCRWYNIIEELINNG